MSTTGSGIRWKATRLVASASDEVASLWRDWQQAVAIQPPVELGAAPPQLFERFCCDVRLSDRVLRATRASRRSVDGTPARSPSRRGDVFDTALKTCAMSCWPDGYRRRRDGWLLVLMWGLGLTRREALSVTGQDIRIESTSTEPLQLVLTVGDTAYRWTSEDGQDPLSCWGCAMVRWWQCRVAEHVWSRAAVRQRLRDQQTVLADHVCASNVAWELLQDLPGWITLAPGLDRHGWISTGHDVIGDGSGELREKPMTPRSVTTLLAGYAGRWSRSEDDGGASGEVINQSVTTQPLLEEDIDVVLDRLDMAYRAADEANERMRRLLADTTGMSSLDRLD